MGFGPLSFFLILVFLILAAQIRVLPKLIYRCMTGMCAGGLLAKLSHGTHAGTAGWNFQISGGEMDKVAKEWSWVVPSLLMEIHQASW